MSNGAHPYDPSAPLSSIPLVEHHLVTNTIRRLVLGSTPQCFLSPTAARRLRRPLRSNTSLRALVLYRRHASLPAVGRVLWAAAGCRGLTSLTLVTECTQEEVEALAPALGAFGLPPTKPWKGGGVPDRPHYAAPTAASRRWSHLSSPSLSASSASRVRAATGRSPGVSPNGGWGRLLGGDRGSLCPSSSDPSLEAGRGCETSNVGWTPCHSVSLTLVFHRLDAAMVDGLVEGLRKGERITDIVLRVHHVEGRTSQERKDLQQYASSLEAVAVRNRERMRDFECQASMETSRPSSPHASLYSVPLQPSRFVSGANKKQLLRPAGVSLARDVGKAEGTLRPSDASPRFRSLVGMLGANERRQAHASGKVVSPDTVWKPHPPRGFRTTGVEQKTCVAPCKPKTPLKYGQQPHTSYPMCSPVSFHRIRGTYLGHIGMPLLSDVSKITNGYFAPKGRPHSYVKGTMLTPPSRRYSPAQLIPQPPQRQRGCTALSTRLTKHSDHTAENVGVKSHRGPHLTRKQLQASPYQSSPSSSPISSRISHWRGTSSSASSTAMSSPLPRPPARSHGKLTEAPADGRLVLSANVRHYPCREKPPSSKTLSERVFVEVPSLPQCTLFMPSVPGVEEQPQPTSPAGLNTQSASTNILPPEAVFPPSDSRGACAGFASAHRCFVCKLLGVGGCSPKPSFTTPHSASQTQKKSLSKPRTSCEGHSKTLTLPPSTKKAEDKGCDSQLSISSSSTRRKACEATLRLHERSMEDASLHTSKGSTEIPTSLCATLKPCHCRDRDVPPTASRNSFTMKEIHDAVKTTSRQLDRRAHFRRLRSSNSSVALYTSRDRCVAKPKSLSTSCIFPLNKQVENVQRPVPPPFPSLNLHPRWKSCISDAWIGQPTNDVEESIKDVEEGDSEEITPLKEYPSLEVTPRVGSTGALLPLSPTQTRISHLGKSFEIASEGAVIGSPVLLASSPYYEPYPTRAERRHPLSVTDGLEGPHSLQRLCFEQLQESVQNIQAKLETYCVRVKEEVNQITQQMDQLSGVMAQEVLTRLSDILVVFKNIEKNQMLS
ncbi:unnamed protein product [Phytomonas sp. Hart1]|nr:unnamed protein product [Phytomonas sp. Hart1]|eukprot:CCW67718.1 unnamed protein product [Phytomonas sp. isolate Hart1]